MGFPRNFLLLFGAHVGDARSDARGVARRYNVPDDKKFCYGTGEKEFIAFSEDCMADADLDTKIIFVGHGGTLGFGEFSSDDWGPFLVKKCGIKRVGLICFKGCKFGAGSGPEEVANYLDAKGVEFGFLEAYKKDVWYTGNGQFRSGKFANSFYSFGGSLFLDKRNKGTTVRVIRGNAKVDHITSIKHLDLAEDLQDPI